MDFFSHDKMYNPQNERTWVINHGEANGKGGVKQKQKIQQKLMVWLGVRLEGVTPLVIMDK